MDYGNHKVFTDEDYEQILDDLRNGRAQLVDVREESEWNSFRFECAIHLPLSKLANAIGIDKLKEIKEANKKIYLHCRSGARVKMAEKILAQYGCREFSILPISMMEMLQKGFRQKQDS